MDIKHQNQLLCSTIRVHNRTKYYGDADVIPVMVLSMIYDLMSQCIELSPECTLKLNMIIHKMERSKDICQIRGGEVFMEGQEDLIPIRVSDVTSNSISVDSNTLYIPTGISSIEIDSSMFIKNYTGPDPGQLIIRTLPRYGTLLLNGNKILANESIPFKKENKIVYYRDSVNGYQSPFTFQIVDKQLNITTNMANFTIMVDGKVNQPPIVGDGSALTDYNTDLVFTRDMFTTNTTPPYNDPEGDAPLMLKIMTLPTFGTIKLRGVPISSNQEFSFIDDIDQGALTYTPDSNNVNEQNLDFTFAIKDAGSGQYAE